MNRFALYDKTRKGYMIGGSHRNVLWDHGGQINQALMYDTEQQALTSAKRLMTSYNRCTKDSTYQRPYYETPEFVVHTITLTVSKETVVPNQ